MNSEHIAIGRLGEDLAAAHLTQGGMKILDRNWRRPGIEIDIVAMASRTLVIAEVKTRKSATHGLPAEAVNARKLEIMRRGAAQYLATHRLSCSGIRFDVVSVVLGPRGQHTISHIQGVGV